MLKTFVKNILIILFAAFLIIPLILMVLNYYNKPRYYEGNVSITKPSYSFEFRNAVATASVVDTISGNVAVTLSGGAYYDTSGMVLDGTSAYASLDAFEMGGGDMTFEVYVNYNTNSNAYMSTFEFGSWDLSENVISFQRDNLSENNEFNVAFPTMEISDNWVFTPFETPLKKGVSYFGDFQHYVIKYNTSSVSIYLNGSLLENYNISGKTIPLNMIRTAQKLGVSNDTLTNPQIYGNTYMDGTLGYLRIWDGTALDDSEISYLYSNRTTVGLFKETDLTMVIASTTTGVTNGSTTNDPTITLTFTSNNSTSDFVQSDINVNGGTLGTFTGTGTTYSAIFTPSGTGQCTIDIDAGKFTDSLGNTNIKSTQFVWTYGSTTTTTGPTMTITSTTTGVTNGSTTDNSNIGLTFTSSEITTDFSINDIDVSGGTLGDLSGSGKIYTTTFTPTKYGVCTIDVSAGTFTDSIGNTNSAATQFVWTYDNSGETTGSNPWIDLLSSDELQSFLSGVLSQYSSETCSQTISGGDTQSYNWASSSNIKCVADNGSEPGNPLCCGQEGVLQDTTYNCPSEYPYCEGYVCGETWGKCKATSSSTSTGMTYGQWVGST